MQETGKHSFGAQKHKKSPSWKSPSWVTGCRDDARRATDGLPSAADAPSQRSELAKSANNRDIHALSRAYTKKPLRSQLGNPLVEA